LGTALKKILIIEDELIVALDIKYILLRSGSYFPIIIKSHEDLLSFVKDEVPELIIVSSNIYEKISKEILTIMMRFNPRLIVLSTNFQYDWNQKPDQWFDMELISKPFASDLLINKVEKIIQNNPFSVCRR
jgi:DNA-binding NtrC family response regulator